MGRIFFSVVVVCLFGWGVLLGESKKEAREARKAAAAEKGLAEELERMPPLAPIGNAPYPEVNRTLRLSAERLANGAAAIDRLVEAGLKKAGMERNAPVEDAVFVRRIYLDVVGRIPSSEEATAFLEDEDPGKRGKLIDALLVSDGYRSHQFNWFADMLRLQSGIKRANFALFQRWLKDGLRENQGWDRLVYEMLTAEGSLASVGASGYLLRDAGMPLDGLSNTLTLFLGANVSCAQCHDHPLAEWTQREFYEMAAFFGSTDVSYRDPRKVGNAIKGDGLSKQDGIMAVAQNLYRVKTLGENGLVFPDDYAYDDVEPGSVVEPILFRWAAGDQEGPAYQVPTDDPKTSRESFAKWMTHPENPRFAVSIANRVWKRMFGIAVKEPIEDLDDLSEASNPELLAFLGEVLVAVEFDLREFQRVLLHTQTYQAVASSTPPLGESEDWPFPGPVLRRMTAEQAWDSLLVLGYGSEVDGLLTDRSHMTTRYAMTYDDYSVSAWRERTAQLKEAGYLDGGSRLGSRDLVDPKKVPERFGKSYVLRASELPQPERDAHFLRMFGQSSRELADDGSVEGNIPQTLMLMNGEFQKLLMARDSRLMRSLQAKGTGPVIEALYLHFYSRKPSAGEVMILESAMGEGLDIEQLVWTLFNTPEFLFVQ